MSRESGEAGASARQTVRWARQSLDGWGRGPQDVVAELRSVVYATNALERAAVLYVMAARDRGATWAVIGEALGVSRQAARQRYAGAVRRREARRADFAGGVYVGAGLADRVERRGVWEGTQVRVTEQRKEHRGVDPRRE